MIRDADSHQISWIEWSYCGCEDPTGTVPPSTEGLVANPRLPGTGANVNEAKLAVLAEPYPRLVAGTPASYSFDAASHRFRLVYTTRSPTAHTFGTGACTAVVIPSIQFPHGYVVQVSGARVSSAPDAGVLMLAQVGASDHTVKLEVRPATKGKTGAPAVADLEACE